MTDQTPAVPTAGEADQAADAYATLVAFSGETSQPFHIVNLARCYLALSAHRERLRSALEQAHNAMCKRIEAGHNDTCGSQLVAGESCTCGHAALWEALRSPAASPKEG